MESKKDKKNLKISMLCKIFSQFYKNREEGDRENFLVVIFRQREDKCCTVPKIVGRFACAVDY
jgi:hypothetical protein